MADSTRSQVISAFVSAVDGSTEVKTASEEHQTWWNLPVHSFPYVWCHDLDTDVEQVAFSSTSLMDKEATLRMMATGFVQDMKGSVTRIAKKRTDMLSGIEKSVMSSTALKAIVISVDPVRIATDDDTVDNFGIGNIEFRVVYHYNHLVP